MPRRNLELLLRHKLIVELVYGMLELSVLVFDLAHGRFHDAIVYERASKP